MVVNGSDSKSTFQSWVTRNNMTCVGVSRDDGAVAIRSAVNSNSAGATYLVKPDRSWKKTTSYASESDLTSAGVKPHTCGGADVIAPSLSITAPVASTIVKVGATMALKWTAADNIGIASRAIRFTDNPDNISSWALIDSTAGNTSGIYSWKVINKVSKTCKFKITVYDAAKNSKTSESVLFEIQPASSINYNPEFVKNSIKLRNKSNVFMVYIPFTGTSEVSIIDINGKRLSSLKTSGNSNWYTVATPLNSGMYIVNIKTGNKTITEKAWLVK